MAKGTVVTEQGKKMKVAAKVAAGGWVPCPGEAHTEAHTDNCMICLGSEYGYGKLTAYKPPTVEQVLAGFAVPVSMTCEGCKEFQKAEAEGKIAMVNATEKWGCGNQSNYNVWAKA